jgi:hypothetical protein
MPRRRDEWACRIADRPASIGITSIRRPGRPRFLSPLFPPPLLHDTRKSVDAKATPLRSTLCPAACLPCPPSSHFSSSPSPLGRLSHRTLIIPVPQGRLSQWPPPAASSSPSSPSSSSPRLRPSAPPPSPSTPKVTPQAPCRHSLGTLAALPVVDLRALASSFPACSAGADRHPAGAARPARRARQLGPGLRRPLQLGHDHLLRPEPRHRPVSSAASLSSAVS